MTQFIRVMTVVFHLPMLGFRYSGLPMVVIQSMLPFVLFDYTENPYGKDITSIITFKEYTSEELNEILSAKIQSIGYGSPIFVVVQQGLILAFFVEILKFVWSIFYRIGMHYYEKEALTFKGLIFALLSGFIGILNEGSFDIVMGCYLQNLNPEELTGPERVSYYIGLTLLTIVALVLPCLILWVYYTDKRELETEYFKGVFSSLYIETKTDKLLYIVLLYIRKFGFIAVIRFVETPYMQIAIIHFG